MCGIAGVYHFQDRAPVSRDLVAAMCDDLGHRGPDDRGQYRDLDGRLALGHTRLSIIDLATGHQPMSSADGGVTVVFNGEIYNHRELRARLAHRAFRTASDTEVILHLYEEHGLDAFRMLGGMFAIALWDRRAHRLVLVRDRLGIKPLYYAATGGGLAFASEVGALLRAPIPRRVDPLALRYYLALRAVPAPLTLFRDVRKLRPGHLLVCDASGPSPETSFWTLEGTAAPAEAADLVADLRERVAAAVQAHMLSDVPIGALLSGGLDSSFIVACMRRHAKAELHTFSVGAHDPRYSELPRARLVARRLGTVHHEHVLTPKDFLEFLPRLVDLSGDPVADPATIPLYYLARAARRLGVKVLLSGEGSDELFAGYPSYQRFVGAGGGWRAAVRSLRGRTEPPRHPYAGHAALERMGILSRLLSEDTGADLPIIDDYRRVAAEAGMDPLQRMLYVDIKTRLPEDLLARTDRVTMANGVEARVPFLDHGLVEHALWMPTRLKIRNGIGKHVLRQAAAPWVPPEVVGGEKLGFPTPVRAWLTGDLRQFFVESLVGVREEPALFDPAVLQQLVTDHWAGRADWSTLLWRVWFFKVWYTRWIRQEPVTTWPRAAARGRRATVGGGAWT